MRITGGKARGIPLKVPPGDKVRPAMDATREAVFSHLGPRIIGSEVLDLFSGSGAYGLEALSRGADSCVFVEKDGRTLSSLEANLAAVLKSLGSTGMGKSFKADAFSWKPVPPKTFDIIFADPPYHLLEDKGQGLLEHIAATLTPSPLTRLLLEAPGSWEPEELEGLTLIRRLGKGRHQPSVMVFEVST